MIQRLIIALFLALGAIALLFLSKKFYLKDTDESLIDDLSEDYTPDEGGDLPAEIVAVPGHHFLYYSLLNHDVFTVSFSENGKTLTPFISNGHSCKIIGEKVVEVSQEGDTIAVVFSANLPD